jgi:two-component system chemotaxis response regulator CheY
MPKRVLIVDGSILTAENLRLRLSPLADVQVVSEAAAVDSHADQPWDLVVCDAALGGWEGSTLWARLRPKDRPVFLYTDRSELVEGGTWAALGLSRAFTRLQRADLVLAAETLLAPAAVSGAAPAFLVVEDSATVRHYVKQVLNQGYQNCEVLEAEDGKAALAAMKTARISLIVTDLQMPGMDGLSFVQLLRNNAVLKRKPVLVLSGAVSDEARENLRALDRVQVLAKPASPEALLGAVRQLLS